MNRKVVSLFSLLLILLLTSSPALAAGGSTEKAEIAASLRSFLSSFLEMGRWIIDPNGMMAPADPTSETDGRSTIDPNG